MQLRLHLLRRKTIIIPVNIKASSTPQHVCFLLISSQLIEVIKVNVHINTNTKTIFFQTVFA